MATAQDYEQLGYNFPPQEPIEQGNGSKTGIKHQGQIPAARRMSDSVMANLRMPLLLFTDEDADTLVFIDAAESEKTAQHRWGPASRSDTATIPQRMHSRKLLGAGSSVLTAHFEPRKQARVRRRFGLTQKMPAGIKYAIDLTPPSEGEDAVIYMTELSCPLGVRQWARLAVEWRLPPLCVCGRDEVEWVTVTESDSESSESLPAIFCNTSSQANEQKGKRARKKELKKQMKKAIKNERKEAGEKQREPEQSPRASGLPILQGDSPEKQSVTIDFEKHSPQGISVPGLPFDYSPIRHRTCLERILHALEGLDPKLDTPCKMWTFFALAKILGVAENPLVGDHIVAWLYAVNNPLFVEVNPELAYKMACGLKNAQLCQDSFAILVGEEALLLLNSTVNGEIPKRADETMHGRMREQLNDTETQGIEYASKAFLDRMLNDFVDLAGTEMVWLDKLVRQNIEGTIEPDCQSIVDDFVKFCKDCVRTEIYKILRGPMSAASFSYPILASKGYPGMKYQCAINDMPYICRILTRTFWKCLSEHDVTFSGWRDTALDQWHTSLKALAPMLTNLKHQDDATIRWIDGFEYFKIADRFHAQVNHPNAFPLAVQFDYLQCQSDITAYLGQRADRFTHAFGEPFMRRDGVRFELVDTLVSLNEDELKFLPLWAGGNDDGTGGVFVDQDLPIVESGGFSTAGPSIRTGSTTGLELVASEDETSSFVSVSPDDAASTVQRASHEATDSHATIGVLSTVSSAALSSTASSIVRGVQAMDLRSQADQAGVADTEYDDSSEYSDPFHESDLEVVDFGDGDDDDDDNDD